MHEHSDIGALTDASTGSSRESEPVSGVTIGVDVGGTKIAAGVVDGHGTMLRTARRPTPRHDSSAVLAEVADVVNELQAGVDGTVIGVGVGVAGGVDQSRSLVYFAPNLAWIHVPVRTVLEAATGLACVVENDLSLIHI